MTTSRLLLLVWLVLNGCGTHLSLPPARTIAGIYAFSQYNTVSSTSFGVAGSITVAPVDDTHVDLTSKGKAGKTQLTYSYRNVVVTDTGPDYLGEETYGLVYKGKQIGTIGHDDIGRYITLMLKPNTTLIAQIPDDV